MSEGNTGEEFLIQRYPRLAKSPEIAKATHRTKMRTGEVIPKDPEAQIKNYLDRFKEIVERDDPKEKENGVRALKKILTDQYVVRVEDVPESYWQAQMRVVRQRGEAGDWQETSEEEQLRIKQEHLAQTKEDQKGSLEEWIDYLASDKSSYLPDHLKYWAFQGMLRLERYEKGDKEKGIPGRFPEWPTGRQRSVKMFPEVNENGLKFIASAYKQQAAGQSVYWGYNQDIPSVARQSFQDAITRKDFRKAYGWVQEHIPPITDEEMQITAGDNCGWVTFSRDLGNTGQDVADTLSGKGTGWCIAGKETAQRNYLDQGAKLQIYYTRNRDGKQENPRVVIVEQGGRVTEVRGVEWEENVDKYIKESSIIGDKLKEIPGGEDFFETDRDTKFLTQIDRKMSDGGILSSDELAFLYETEKPILYFGYKKDPRITELRSKRHAEEDMLIIFDCELSQIAYSTSQIHLNTKAYVGKLEPGIFDKLQGIEHIYTSFPEGKIRVEDLAIGGRSKDQLGKDLKQRRIKYSYAEDMIKNPDFTTLPTSEVIKTVRLKVQDLGFKDGATTAEIIGTKDDIDEYGKLAPFTKGRMTQLGLDLCLPEVGIYQRLKDTNQSLGEWYYIAMKPISDHGGYPDVFELVRYEDGLWLFDFWAAPGYGWLPEGQFVFCLRKSETQNTQTPGLLDRIFRR